MTSRRRITSQSNSSYVFVPSLFFFQAEDGIRDIGVTRVQTCALPICFELRHGIFLLIEAQNSISVSNIDTAWPLIQTLPSASPLNSSSTSTRPGRWSDAPWMPEKRSEERRVGKGSGTGWTADTEQEKR